MSRRTFRTHRSAVTTEMRGDEIRSKMITFIREYVATHMCMPSMRTIAQHVGLASVSSVWYHLEHLKRLGLVQKKGRSGWILSGYVPPASPVVEANDLYSLLDKNFLNSLLAKVEAYDAMRKRLRHLLTQALPPEVLRDIRTILEGDGDGK